MMDDNSTEELIAVWGENGNDSREVHFYSKVTENGIEFLLEKILGEEFFEKFVHEVPHPEKAIPVTIEMLDFQAVKGKHYWYECSKEILEKHSQTIAEKGIGRNVSQEELKNRLNFLRQLSIANLELPAAVADDSETIKRLEHVLDLLRALKITKHRFRNIEIDEKIFHFEKTIKELKEKAAEEQNKKMFAKISDSQKSLEKLERQQTISVPASASASEANTKVVITNAETFAKTDERTGGEPTVDPKIDSENWGVNSSPITIISNKSQNILAMADIGVIRLEYLNIKGLHSGEYYCLRETSLRFYKWYSNTRCELIFRDRSFFLPNIKWSTKGGQLSSEEIAIISRVFLLEKIKLVRSALKNALATHFDTSENSCNII